MDESARASTMEAEFEEGGRVEEVELGAGGEARPGIPGTSKLGIEEAYGGRTYGLQSINWGGADGKG